MPKKKSLQTHKEQKRQKYRSKSVQYKMWLTQAAMERYMLGLFLPYRVPNTPIR